MPTPYTKSSFESFRLSQETLHALKSMGFYRPTPVQAASYSPLVEGHDLMVQSQTGSGKTAAYGIPLAEMLNPLDKRVQALILVPTRELANQVSKELDRIFSHRELSVTAVYGGAGMGGQITELKSGVQVVAGTPGRVLDHLQRKTLTLAGLRIFVLDEADEMLSMGFAKDLDAILEFLPTERQSLLFSATLPEDIRELGRRFLINPEIISLSEKVAAKEVSHEYYLVPGVAKQRDLVRLIQTINPENSIIFCNTREETHFLATYLKRKGFDAEEISSDLSQKEREKVMTALKQKKLRFLVATDVAARGIDVSQLSYVINYSVPEHHEVYIHRTGRTGRAGQSGTAITLVSPKNLGDFISIRKIYKINFLEKSLPIQETSSKPVLESQKTSPQKINSQEKPSKQLKTQDKPKTKVNTKEKHLKPSKPKETPLQKKPPQAPPSKTALETFMKTLSTQTYSKEEETLAQKILSAPNAAKLLAALLAKTKQTQEVKPTTSPTPAPLKEPPSQQRATLPTLQGETWENPQPLKLSPQKKQAVSQEEEKTTKPLEAINKTVPVTESTNTTSSTKKSEAKPSSSTKTQQRKSPRPSNMRETTKEKTTASSPKKIVENAKDTAMPQAKITPPTQAEAKNSLQTNNKNTNQNMLPSTNQETPSAPQEINTKKPPSSPEHEAISMTRLYLNLGRRDEVRASEVTRFLRKHISLNRRDLGRVQVRDTFSHIGIRTAMVQDVIKAVHGTKFNEKDVIIDIAKGKN